LYFVKTKNLPSEFRPQPEAVAMFPAKEFDTSDKRGRRTGEIKAESVLKDYKARMRQKSKMLCYEGKY
jgi:hypothetical protein